MIRVMWLFVILIIPLAVASSVTRPADAQRIAIEHERQTYWKVWGQGRYWELNERPTFREHGVIHIVTEQGPATIAGNWLVEEHTR